jgi:putative solute:sodium symporter small subunit
MGELRGWVDLEVEKGRSHGRERVFRSTGIALDRQDVQTPARSSPPRRAISLESATAMSLDRTAYWRATLRRIVVLLAIWAMVGPVMSILFVEQLNRLTIAGVPFGFWMGQQGSIYVFVILIFVNAWMADRLDRTARIRDQG